MGNEFGDHNGEVVDKKKLSKPYPTYLERLGYGAHIYTIKGLLGLPSWYRGWKEYFNPPPGGPNIVKSYDSRRHLPVRYVNVVAGWPGGWVAVVKGD